MAVVEKSTVEGSFITYKGKPFVRQGHMMCYGSLQDDYIMQFITMKNKEVTVGGVKNEVPAMVIVQILKKNAETGAWDAVKQFNKNGLYDAFSIGYNYMQSLQK